jgi:hypothetical protein
MEGGELQNQGSVGDATEVDACALFRTWRPRLPTAISARRRRNAAAVVFSTRIAEFLCIRRKAAASGKTTISTASATAISIGGSVIATMVFGFGRGEYFAHGLS